MDFFEIQTAMPPRFGDYILIAALNPCHSGYHGSKIIVYFIRIICKYLVLRSYTRSTAESSALPLRVTVVGRTS